MGSIDRSSARRRALTEVVHGCTGQFSLNICTVHAESANGVEMRVTRLSSL